MPRILTGLLLAFVVSIVNGVAGLSYTLGGTGVETAMATAGDDAAATDLPWDGERRQLEPKQETEPRGTGATVLALLETPSGRLGLGLQLLCVLQFLAGALVVLRHRAGVVLTCYLLMVAALGFGAEYAGSQFSGRWGAFNTIGVFTSALLALVCLGMARTGRPAEAAPGG